MTACLLVAQKACLTCIYATFHLASCRQLSVALHGALYRFPPDGLSLPSGKPTASRPQQRKLQGETNHKTSRVHSQLGLGNPGSGMPGSFWTAYIITRCPDLREIKKSNPAHFKSRQALEGIPKIQRSRVFLSGTLHGLEQPAGEVSVLAVHEKELRRTMSF